MLPAPLRLGLAALAVFVLGACAPKIVRERVLEKPGARVELRHREGGEPLGYTQPATISDVRIAHILASLIVDDGKGAQTPLIRAQYVYDLAEGIAQALAKAGPDDEIAAAAFPEDKRLGIFTDSKVTAFRVVLVQDEMRIEVYAFEQPLERDGGKIGTREYDIPTELPVIAPRFKLVPGTAQTREGTRGVNVSWRDPYYRKPVNLSFSGGQTKRRTVLMEMPPEEAPPAPGRAHGAPAPSDLPPGLSDAQLSALDRLDAARLAGQVTEAQYQRKRRLILENQLEEAGAPQ
jgi:hypothetical protein